MEEQWAGFPGKVLVFLDVTLLMIDMTNGKGNLKTVKGVYTAEKLTLTTRKGVYQAGLTNKCNKKNSSS